jgi:Uma2 family endonuclease
VRPSESGLDARRRAAFTELPPGGMELVIKLVKGGARIAEYWVVDLKANCLHVFTLEGDRYRETILERGGVSPRAFPDVTINLEGLFGVR